MRGIYLNSKQVKKLIELGWIYILRPITSKTYFGKVKIWLGKMHDKYGKVLVGRGLMEFLGIAKVEYNKNDNTYEVLPDYLLSEAQYSGYDTIHEWLTILGIKGILKKPKRFKIYKLFLNKLSRKYINSIREVEI
ncbi:hypothetical protein JDFR1000234_46 [uncultured archaeal virus]|jgi:hypothetical protein|uniref:Uncharacterized protein n=1 Tax=uncultured archaeal virus TaxID=1960247 RepID=A0A1S5Y333_9VIRU|nr:hypothetical protein JDFR1000234_46 [uncultured archaeal virus]